MSRQQKPKRNTIGSRRGRPWRPDLNQTASGDPGAVQTADATPNQALQRLEQELAALQADTETLQEGFGPASLQLEIIKTHVGSTLLNNAAVVRWLAKYRPDHLQQLQKLSEIKHLPG
jgi:hypothetical protein